MGGAATPEAPLLLAALATVALADPDLDHAWYLWRTGRTEPAVAAAEAQLAETPEDIAWLQLALVAGVDAGEGARLEHRYREAVADAPMNPTWRAALATTLAVRNPTTGRWCSEMGSLLSQVSATEAPDATWLGLRARTVALRACDDNADKIGIDLRRTADDTALAVADGVIDRLEAGYAKLDLPPDLEAALVAEPLRVRDVAAAWNPTLTGVAVAQVRGVVRKRLVELAASERPAELWAAMDGWRDSGNLRKAELAAARLTELDPDVDPSVDRSPDAVQDPAVYGEILAAVELGAGAVAALDALQPTSAAARAAVHDARAGVLDAPEARVAARRDAWKATPDDRLYALRLARDAASTGLHAVDALAALDVVLADRAVDPLAKTPGPLDERRRPRFVELQDLRATLQLAATDPESAVSTRQELLLFGVTPARLARLGLALHAAGDGDAAVLHLAAGVHVGGQAPDLAAAARAALTKDLSAGWAERGLGGVIVDAVRAADAEAPEPAWLGQALPIADLAPPLEPGPDGELPERVRLLTWVASWDGSAVHHLEHVAAAASDRGDAVEVFAFAVDAREVGWTRWLGGRELAVPTTWVGAGPLAPLGAVRLPYTVLVTADGMAADVIQAHGGSDDDRLESALDERVGKED
ncbi:MAG: hypothetical protein ACI8PZ_003582 [Myxococcota bacterium]|jgi:hypothetical protein